MKFSFPSAINITYSEENLVLETKYNIESTQLDNFIAHVTIVNSKFTSKFTAKWDSDNIEESRVTRLELFSTNYFSIYMM